MFWDKAYTSSQNIDDLLNKENVKVEDFLDEDDILQECKSDKNVINYFTRPDVIKRLVELVTTEPSENLPFAQRFRHANMACEILTFGLPSLNEKLLSDGETLNTLYSYLENEPPLNPLLSSFFSKTFIMLFTKKLYHDWFLYQKMCLQLIEYIKSRGTFLDLLFRHFSTPVIPDLLIQMLNEVEGGALKKNLYEWLTEEKLVGNLVAILSNPKESEKHTNAAELLCELITQGRNMRLTEQENDSFEPAFVGSNPILQTIESEATINSLLDTILDPSATENAIISGILVVLTLITPVAFEDNPLSDRARIMQEKEEENHKNVILTVISIVKPRIEKFINILRNPPRKSDMLLSGAKVLPPFGSTRLEICRFFTVLLRTGNEDITKAICETEYFTTILALFKDYCWNNFLHSEVEKCMGIVFASDTKNGRGANGKTDSISSQTKIDGSFHNDLNQIIIENKKNSANLNNSLSEEELQAKASKTPSALQTSAIVNSKVVSKLIDCWIHNNEMQKTQNGRRLGYMGHLMKIFKHITACISESDHIGALIESSLSESELEQWQSIIRPNDGEFTVALAVQNRMLANCNAYESVDFSQNVTKEFFNDDFSSEIITEFTENLNNLYHNLEDGPMTEILETEDVHNFNVYFAACLDEYLNASETKNLSTDHWGSSATSMDVAQVGMDPFNDMSLIEQTDDNKASIPMTTTEWPDFADFDSHFSQFTSDLGECFGDNRDAGKSLIITASSSPETNAEQNVSSISTTERDDNANIENRVKSLWSDPVDDFNEVFDFGNTIINKEDDEVNNDKAWVMTIKTTAENTNVLTNGPTNIPSVKDIENLSSQLNNININENKPYSSAPNPVTFNEDDDQKLLTALTDNNAQNIASPSSINDSLCQEHGSSKTIPISQDTKLNSTSSAIAAD